MVALLAIPGPASGERATTRDALDRLEEILELRQEDGLLDPRDVLPTILVGATPLYEASQGGYVAQVLTILGRVFGSGTIRNCEACLRRRTLVEGGRLEQTSGPIGLDEIIRLDDRFRGSSARAKTAIWVDETTSGVAVRIIGLRSGRVVFAQNIDPSLLEYRRSARTFRLSAELERRTRGDSLTHAIFDTALYPGQHVSLEWNDQWGENNANLSGIVLSFFDPVLGLGAGYYRALQWQNILIGGKLILSIPTVIAESQTDGDAELLDPALTGVFVMRVPFGASNYAVLLSVSTNGEAGVGLSFLNTSLIPVLP